MTDRRYRLQWRAMNHYACAYHGCPRRDPVKSETAPICYTCGQPMAVSMWVHYPMPAWNPLEMLEWTDGRIPDEYFARSIAEYYQPYPPLKSRIGHVAVVDNPPNQECKLRLPDTAYSDAVRKTQEQRINRYIDDIIMDEHLPNQPNPWLELTDDRIFRRLVDADITCEPYVYKGRAREAQDSYTAWKAACEQFKPPTPITVKVGKSTEAERANRLCTVTVTKQLTDTSHGVEHPPYSVGDDVEWRPEPGAGWTPGTVTNVEDVSDDDDPHPLWRIYVDSATHRRFTSMCVIDTCLRKRENSNG